MFIHMSSVQTVHVHMLGCSPGREEGKRHIHTLCRVHVHMFMHMCSIHVHRACACSSVSFS